MSDLDSRNIWLRKGEEIIGLHAIGYNEPHEQEIQHLDGSIEKIARDFLCVEKWGNEYNQEFQVIGRGSFRVHDLTIEDTAKAFEEDGWERFEGPIEDNNNG